MWNILGPILGIVLAILLAVWWGWALKNWLTQHCDSPLDAFLGDCDEENNSWQIRPGNPWE